jgi:hypothetical protein
VQRDLRRAALQKLRIPDRVITNFQVMGIAGSKDRDYGEGAPD